jgi:hypothetical protein
LVEDEVAGGNWKKLPLQPLSVACGVAEGDMRLCGEDMCSEHEGEGGTMQLLPKRWKVEEVEVTWLV